MKITGSTSSPSTVPAASASAVTPGATKPGDQPASRRPAAPRSDSVKISDAGRALARQVEGTFADAPGGELTADRIAEVRQRIRDGAYGSAEVIDEVARRMLERGDI